MAYVKFSRLLFLLLLFFYSYEIANSALLTAVCSSCCSKLSDKPPVAEEMGSSETSFENACSSGCSASGIGGCNSFSTARKPYCQFGFNLKTNTGAATNLVLTSGNTFQLTCSEINSTTGDLVIITSSPTSNPTLSPTTSPTLSPTNNLTLSPTSVPSTSPTNNPTESPNISTESPTNVPGAANLTFSPTISPTLSPTPFVTNETTSGITPKPETPKKDSQSFPLVPVVAGGSGFLAVLVILSLLLFVRRRRTVIHVDLEYSKNLGVESFSSTADNPVYKNSQTAQNSPNGSRNAITSVALSSYKNSLSDFIAKNKENLDNNQTQNITLLKSDENLQVLPPKAEIKKPVKPIKPALNPYLSLKSQNSEQNTESGSTEKRPLSLFGFGRNTVSSIENIFSKNTSDKTQSAQKDTFEKSFDNVDKEIQVSSNSPTLNNLNKFNSFAKMPSEEHIKPPNLTLSENLDTNKSRFSKGFSLLSSKNFLAKNFEKSSEEKKQKESRDRKSKHHHKTRQRQKSKEKKRSSVEKTALQELDEKINIQLESQVHKQNNEAMSDVQKVENVQNVQNIEQDKVEPTGLEGSKKKHKKHNKTTKHKRSKKLKTAKENLESSEANKKEEKVEGLKKDEKPKEVEKKIGKYGIETIMRGKPANKKVEEVKAQDETNKNARLSYNSIDKEL